MALTSGTGSVDHENANVLPYPALCHRDSLAGTLLRVSVVLGSNDFDMADQQTMMERFTLELAWKGVGPSVSF